MSANRAHTAARHIKRFTPAICLHFPYTSAGCAVYVQGIVAKRLRATIDLEHFLSANPPWTLWKHFFGA